MQKIKSPRPINRQFLWALALLFSITLIFSLFFELGATNPEEVGFGTIIERIEDGSAKSIEVSGDEVRVVLADGGELVAQKEPGADFIGILRDYGVSSSTIRSVAFTVKEPGGAQYWLGILIPTLLPIIIMVFIFWWIFRQAKTGVNQAFTFGKANSRLFAPTRDKVTFKDVAGLKESKEELEEIVDFLKNPKKFLDMGAKIPRGVILMGPPGTGKTLLARAVAGESNVPFFHISASEFVEMFVGVGASRVRDLFQTAKKGAPSIIFIDEIDAVGRERGTGLGGGHDEREQTLNQILVEMDGFDRETNVIVMAATNRADILDSALLRPGRFDRRVMLDMPDISDREAILKIHSKGKPLEEREVNLKTVAVRTPGFSGADLANLLNEAAIVAARAKRQKISQDDILTSIEKVMLGPARRSRVISQKEKEITAYHEAGHGLVAAGLKEADPVHKISIVSRGMAGGYTLKLPIEERRLITKQQFLTDLAVAFGGYAAEQIVFGDVTTGSVSDIKQATTLAHQLVTRFGMSEKLGPRAFGGTHEHVFLGRELATEPNYSEDLGKVIDAEVDVLIKSSLDLAKKIIVKNRKLLTAIAKELIAKETVEHEEFYKLVKSFKLKPILIV